MKEQNLILLILAAVVLVLIVLFAGPSLLKIATGDETNLTVNDTINETENLTVSNDTVLNNTQNKKTKTETKTVTNKKTSTDKKSSESDIVGESIKENYQAGDGSHYREVQYKDGNIRQYDSNGKLIGSTFESDQGKLKNYYGSMD